MREPGEERFYGFDKFGGRDSFPIDESEAIAGTGAANPDVVFAGSASHKCDFGEKRAGAAIGTPSHAECDGLILETEDEEMFFQLRDEPGQAAFGIRQSLRAPRQTGAG